MNRSATLLIDLQVDFLASDGGRMPVSPADADRVIAAANAVLAGTKLAGTLPILIVNEFPASERVANLYGRKTGFAAKMPHGLQAPTPHRGGGCKQGPSP